MSVVEALHRLGGVAERRALVATTSRAELDRAVRDGLVDRVGHGRYALPLADVALRAAVALDAVVSHRSAALRHGWEVGSAPALPDVVVPRNRKVAADRRRAVTLHRGPVSVDDRRRRTTAPARTVLDCLRSLPFGEALAVAESALRHEALGPHDLLDLARTARGPGAARARRVAAAADARAANPFESVLRSIALDVPGLDVRPQVEIRAPSFSVRPDLVDVPRRVVLEADSFAWHGSRAALRADSQRCNNLVVRDWLVLRFSWEDVMHDPASVRRTLMRAADLAGRRTQTA